MGPVLSGLEPSGYWDDHYTLVRPACGPHPGPPLVGGSIGRGRTIQSSRPRVAPHVYRPAPEPELWKNPAIVQAMSDSCKARYGEVQKGKKRKFLFKGREVRDRAQDFSLRDWDTEFSQAEKIIEDLIPHVILKDLLHEARGHLQIARGALEDSFFPKVEHHLKVIDKIWSWKELALYFDTLSKAGIFVEKMERPLKEANVERFRGGEGRNGTSFFDLLDYYLRELRCLAVCAQMGKRFPGIVFQASICEDAKFPSGISTNIIPILHIGNHAYLPKDRRLHSRPLQVETEEENSNLVISSNSQFEDVFSEDELKPFALSYDLPKEGFVMPNIISEFAKHQKELRHSYVSALFAASLGMTDLVYAYAEFFVKESVRMAFHNQGVEGRFRTDKEGKQKRGSSFIPLSTSAGYLTLRDALIHIEQGYVIDISRLESVSIHSVVPDVYEDTLYNKIHCAKDVAKSIRSIILKIPLRRSKMADGFAAFIPIGPWVFETRISSGRRDLNHNFLSAPP